MRFFFSWCFGPFHSIGVFFFNHDKDGTRQWALTHTSAIALIREQNRVT